MCHEPYPSVIQVSEKCSVNLFDYGVPDENEEVKDKSGESAKISYIVFETIYQQKEVKTIHIVSNAKVQ